VRQLRALTGPSLAATQVRTLPADAVGEPAGPLGTAPWLVVSGSVATEGATRGRLPTGVRVMACNWNETAAIHADLKRLPTGVRVMACNR